MDLARMAGCHCSFHAPPYRFWISVPSPARHVGQRPPHLSSADAMPPQDLSQRCAMQPTPGPRGGLASHARLRAHRPPCPTRSADPLSRSAPRAAVTVRPEDDRPPPLLLLAPVQRPHAHRAARHRRGIPQVVLVGVAHTPLRQSPLRHRGPSAPRRTGQRGLPGRSRQAPEVRRSTRPPRRPPARGLRQRDWLDELDPCLPQTPHDPLVPAARRRRPPSPGGTTLDPASAAACCPANHDADQHWRHVLRPAPHSGLAP